MEITHLKNEIQEIQELCITDFPEIEDMIITITKRLQVLQSKLTLLLLSRMNALENIERQPRYIVPFKY